MTTTATNKVEIRRGLMGVYFDRTDSCFIDGTIGKLLYRGYDIHELAEKSTFEEVIYLLLNGKLPTRRELDGFDRQLRADRDIPDDVLDIINKVKDGHPMDVLRTAVSALSAYDPEVKDNSEAAIIRKGLRLTAKAPTIVAAHDRIRKGLKPVKPNANLNHAGNFLYMLFGKEPSEDEMHIMDVDFILHAEHGANASAFAARVAASTQTDLHSAVVAGIATLKGPAHGGAAEEVMKMAEEIGQPEKADGYARNILDHGGRVMGFGHRVYKAEDPRARHMRERSHTLGIAKGQPQWFEILTKLQEVMKPYQARGIFVNVDFFAGSVYYLMGIPEDIFISIFALGRIPGWTLNVAEQYRSNILIRPLTDYNGPMDLEYVPISQRR
ncbi:MAG: citrate (Si)-synthase [Chloroflexi bacterium]|nr:citrate (Si)-synthase [Chloroflexota bacterium]MBI4197949.1 citrate (Si)-synthase [Chloroflexota bacterium]